MVLLEGVGDALRRASDSGIELFILTNQSPIARGLLSSEGLDAVHKRLFELLADFGVQVTDVLVCPHKPDDHCACRKPRDGLFRELQRVHGATPDESVMVGDSPSDLAAAEAWGCRFVAVWGELFQQCSPLGIWSTDPAQAIRLATDLLA